ncbi:helix-turn-helix domain-containing protein [Legionella londiniensis]|uniref:DNA-binding protein n=1 Tax=Legionella londiniensis TaxID=45068 RepID=A0A0W0VML3_9GAMM|nr:helix-turn-helix domain-containing protein [Legionella londiniensis]KTD21294.1 DNA-binding protein [Legionella londiniensis]STX93320.1 DNA-binding protein [Legionella londiniensis]
MNTVTTLDEIEEQEQEKPGAKLAAIRKEKGFSTDYVAGKLHLRVRIIELLEADDYHSMPEPVFIKGYLRAYAKLLDIPAEPLVETFNSLHAVERKPERALWQSRRETNRAEHIVKIVTALFAISVLVAVAMWWYKNKENERLFPKNVSQQNEPKNTRSEADIRLTDLSNMRSILSSKNSNYSALEIQHD